MDSLLQLPLAQPVLDRDALAREGAELFDQLWLEPETRIMVLYKGKTLLDDGKLRLFKTDEATAGKYRVYLGRTTKEISDLPKNSAIVLSVLSDNAASAIEANPDAWKELRRTGAGLDPDHATIFTQGLAIHNWHETHQFCPACGEITIMRQGGWSRFCITENRDLFPRTDAAVIVSIIDSQGRILLGSQGSWAENRWSVLAGFVEAAESLEAAVKREMFEECGLSVVRPRYLGSQAWPYPYSLMLAFTAEVDSNMSADQIQADGVEIAKLRWFSKEELKQEAKQIHLPTRISIARAMIEFWLGESIVSLTELESGN
ncbi:MAG: NAD(+) diphosphatase [Microbacteriaceae bacterium]|nr:NAD(+) diphosphatase [Microbacteriaceae bacterium]